MKTERLLLIFSLFFASTGLAEEVRPTAEDRGADRIAEMRLEIIDEPKLPSLRYSYDYLTNSTYGRPSREWQQHPVDHKAIFDCSSSHTRPDSNEFDLSNLDVSEFPMTHTLGEYRIYNGPSPVSCTMNIHYPKPGFRGRVASRSHSFPLDRLSSDDANKTVFVAKLRRIDIHHMAVTRSDGSVYEVQGRAKVEIWNEDSDRYETFAEPLATGRGLYVPDGKRYRVTVRAWTEDEQYDSYVSIVDFTAEAEKRQ